MNLVLPEIEQQNVCNVYDNINKDFSITRYKIWPSVENFLNNFNVESKILEVGCGNGKNMIDRPENFYGCDICKGFVNICKEKGLNVVQSDATNLPYEDNFFDVTISIAVIHHLSTIERRKKAIEEMLRVTKVGGSLLVEVWGLENNNKASGPDTMVPWNRSDKIFYRYYHFFEKDEIIDLIKSFSNCEIKKIYWEKFNWLIEFTKI